MQIKKNSKEIQIRSNKNVLFRTFLNMIIFCRPSIACVQISFPSFALRVVASFALSLMKRRQMLRHYCIALQQRNNRHANERLRAGVK